MHKTYRRQWTRRLLFQALVFASLSLGPVTLFGASGNGIEVKPFGLLRVDSSFTARYLFDEQDRSFASGFGNYERRSTWEEEFLLITKSYVYHPGFLNIDLNFGPKLVQQAFDSSVGSNDNDETFLNFLARLNFLELKSYPFSVYYARSNPSVTTGLSGRFLTESNEMGFDTRISGFGKSFLKMNLVHLDVQGSGFGTVVDDVTDRGSVSITTSYGDGDSISIEQSRNILDSSSGSPGLPIQRSRRIQDFTTLIARNYFGSNKKYTVNQSFFRLKQDFESPRILALDSRRYNAAAILQHSRKFRSFLDYRFSETRRTGSNSRNQGIGAKVAYAASENFLYGFRVDHSETLQTGFARNRSSIDSHFTYTRPTRFGSASVGGSLGKARTDQESDAQSIQVFDEFLVLGGTALVELANEFVLPASIIVSNDARTQVFVEGIDYRLVTIGSTTSVQRFLSGNIVDGQAVLVDYEYQTSGTAQFDTFNSSLNVSLRFMQFANARVSYRVRETDVLNGELTNAVNDQQVLEVTVGAEFPLGRSWTIGAEFRHTDQNEDISPAVSDILTVNASTTMLRSMKLFLSASFVQVDHERSTENVDQIQYRLGIRARAWSRVQLGYDLSYLRDTGGSLRRKQMQQRLNMQWNYRKVRFVLRATVSEDTLGLTERRYTQVTATVVRIF